MQIMIIRSQKMHAEPSLARGADDAIEQAAFGVLAGTHWARKQG